MYDLIIIGGGPAAIGAGIYAARRKLKTLLVCQSWGGQLMLAPIVENYLGLEPPLAGMELVNKMVSQLKRNELEIKEGVKVEGVESDGQIVIARNKNDSYQAKTTIIATGRNPKKLGFENEKKYLGKGLSYCSTCDGPLFRDKEVAIIGGGDSGATSVLEMEPYASKIYWIVSTYRATPLYVDKIKKIGKVEIVEHSRAAAIKGNDFVTALAVKNKESDQEKEIKVEGIFVTIGSVPNSSLVENVIKLNEREEIEIDSDNKTSKENIFAAGDVTSVPYKQLAVAAGEGVKAALSVYDYLLNRE